MRTKGWQSVFTFTFIQYIKTKSFIIGTAVICVITAAICVLTNILPVLLDKSDDSEFTPGEAEAEFSAVWLFHDAGILEPDDIEILNQALGENIHTGEDFDTKCGELASASSPEAAVKITAATDDEGALLRYEIRTVYSPNSIGAETINALFSEMINRRILLNAGVSPEDYPNTQVPISTSGIEAGAQQWSIIQSMMNYFIPLVVSLVLFMLIFAYGQTVAQSIATEKTSKVMELLLTSVRPLAVVIGKVLAMGLVSFLTFALIGTVGSISFMISAPFGWVGKALDLARDPAIIEEISQAAEAVQGSAFMSSDAELAQAVGEITAVFTPFNILLIAVVFLLGFLFYSLIAALVGASISRMEDLQAAMQPYALFGVLGMYLAYFPVIFNIESMESGTASTNPVQIFSYFFPVSSPFALPSAILLGTLTPLQSALATLLLAAAVVIVAIVVSKVYEAIILHNGNRIKPADIIKLALRK